MLETVDLNAKVGKDEYKQFQEQLDIRLGELQRAVQNAGIPVLIVFQGWEAAGKGTAIGSLVRSLDPRGFKVYPINAPTQEEALRPPMRRFWLTLPARGLISIYDRSWYEQVLVERVEKIVPKRQWEAAYERIRCFERQLTDDGAVVVKFWLHISKEEQGKRFKKLRKDPALAWKVTDEDIERHKRYGDYYEAVEDMLRETSTPNAPWTLVPAHNRRYAHLCIAETLIAALENALAQRPTPKEAPVKEPTRRTSPLDRVDLTKALTRKKYETELPKLQEELLRLEHLIYVNRVPVILVFEGWDAAGKGGNIRRLTQGLDPRGYEVVPFGAPVGEEKTHHYLWRFWRAVPKAGHMTVFDRSWYGRVLVERIEGFAPIEAWQRAYREICEFEQELVAYGAVLVKFWIHISQEEQLARFSRRQEIPHKQWKITDEDWRNRQRWADYWDAVSDMVERTSTPTAPWTIVEGNDKLHARVTTLRVVLDAITARLKSRSKSKE